MQKSESFSDFSVHRRPSWELTRTNSGLFGTHRRGSSLDFLSERKPSLQDQLTYVLQDYNKCFEFKEYMKSKHCEENLYFWVDVELFKMETNEDINEQAIQIYNKFLASEAEHQVNLDAETVKQITERMATGEVDRTLFDVAQRATFKLMETACIAGFQRFQEELPAVTSAFKKNPSLLKKIFNLKKHQPRTESTKQLSRYFERRPSVEYQES